MLYQERKFEYYFFIIFLFELFICGSGQILHVYGALTLRMLMFFLSFLFVIKHKFYINQKIGSLCFQFLGLLLLGFILNVFSDGLKMQGGFFLDIKPLSYFFSIIPMWYIPNKVLKKIPTIIIASTVFVSVLYLTYLLLVNLGILVDFSTFYESANEIADIKFRGGNGEFFYAGFIYVPIAISFVYFSSLKKYLKIFLILLFFVTVFYTYTRSFYIIAVLCLAFSMLMGSRNKVFLTIAIAVTFVLILVYSGDLYSEIFDSRGDGDEIRIKTFQEVWDRITIISFFIGHGLGVGVPIRPDHMESSYLEIFHKQGLLGLTFWVYLLFYLKRLYSKLPGLYKKNYFPFLLGSFLIYVQSFFNPYIINPMGIGLINLTIVLLYKSKNNNIFYD